MAGKIRKKPKDQVKNELKNLVAISNKYLI